MMFRPLYSTLLTAALGVLLAAPAWARDPPPASTGQQEQRPARSPAQQRWQQMTPKQQEHVRRGVREFKHMKPQQQRRVREAFHDYQALPPTQRRDLRKQWRQQHDQPKPSPRPQQPVPADDDGNPRR